MGEPAAKSASRVEISKKLVLINSASSLVALGLNVTVLVWLQQFLLKRISTAEYSMLPVLYSIMMFAPLLTTMFTRGLARYSTEAYAAGDIRRVTEISSTMFLILLGVGGLVFAVGLALSRNLEHLLSFPPEYQADVKLMLLLLMLSLAFQVVLAPFSVGLEVKQRYVLFNTIRTAGQFLRLAILFGLLFGIGVRVLWVIVATVSAELLTGLAILFFSLRAVPSLRFHRNAVNWPVAGTLLSFGGWSMVSALAITIRTSADAIILNKLGTPLDVTCFYLGALPLRFITLAGSAAQTPLGPALVAMHATGQSERLRRVYLKGGRWALWFTLVICVPLMVYGREIITLYVGSEFQSAGIVMCLLLLLFPIGQGSRMLFPLADATAKVRGLSLSLLVMSVFNLGVTLYLVGVLKMGALGSAIGTTVAILLFYPGLLWPLGLKMADARATTWFRETLWPGLVPGLVMAAVLIGLKTMIPLDSWFTVTYCVAAGLVAYLLALWFGALRKADHAELRKISQALRTKFTRNLLWTWKSLRPKGIGECER